MIFTAEAVEELMYSSLHLNYTYILYVCQEEIIINFQVCFAAYITN